MSQSLEQGKRKLTAKDAITAGALGAVCIAIRFVFMLVGGVSPYVWFATHLIDAILIGPVFMLMVAKVRKNGPFLLTSLVTGVVLVAATWMFPITGLVGGLLCELCLRAGQFRQKSWLVLGFFCFGVSLCCGFLLVEFAGLPCLSAELFAGFVLKERFGERRGDQVVGACAVASGDQFHGLVGDVVAPARADDPVRRGHRARR